jgi:predicted nucleic acid-binding protein
VFVVDSSVWIEFYRDRWGREASLLREAVERDGDAVALCGPILQEVLQGFREAATFARELRRLQEFTVFETTRWTWLKAAALFRRLRAKGVTVNSFDTVIAAVCFEQGVPLLTCNRRDFAPIAKYAGLKLI